MREIKFRVWNKNEAVFHYLKFADYGILSEDDPNTQGFVVYQQYTGLKDENGKEIYEGDILGYPESFDDKTLLEIKWATAYYGGQWCEFVIQNREGKAFDNQDKPNDFYGGVHPDYMIVVGNIFEGADK